jgi:tRNA G18 (ribose-2'-O)-methylase SpoU
MMRITFGLSVAVVNYNREKNIGALFRTAEAFGAQNFMIIGNREIEGKDVEDILRASSGGTYKHLPLLYFKDEKEFYQYAKKRYTIACVEIGKKSIDIREIKKYKEPIVFVLGGEKEGISEYLYEKSDLCIRIPQFGTVSCLNTAVSGSIVLYDFILKNISHKGLEVKGKFSYKEDREGLNRKK